MIPENLKRICEEVWKDAVPLRWIPWKETKEFKEFEKIEVKEKLNEVNQQINL